MAEFDFNTEISETKWLVDKTFPMGHLCFVLAKAGVGKSLIVESLAVHTVHGVDFGGFMSVEGDVLIVDQDTPQNVLTKRLLQFSKGLNVPRKHRLFIESMQGLVLSNNTLISAIHSYPTAKIIIIDSMHSVCGKLNPNSTTDMSLWAHVKSSCLTKDNIIIINHHISEHIDTDTVRLMTGRTDGLAMGNSAIIQQADSYYIVDAEAMNGRTNKIFIRPVSKRVSIPQKPMIFKVVVPESGGETLTFDGYYEPELDEVEKDVMALFYEQKIERTVEEVYKAMGHRHGENSVRKALTNLDKKSYLVFSRSRSNLFKYRLP